MAMDSSETGGGTVGIECSSCGSHFSLVTAETATYRTDRAKTIAHFELIEQVGMGHFGSVWKARDTDLDRTVAVKIPRRGRRSPPRSDAEQHHARRGGRALPHRLRAGEAGDWRDHDDDGGPPFGHARLHVARASRRQRPRSGPAKRRLLAGRHPVRAFHRRASLPRRGAEIAQKTAEQERENAEQQYQLAQQNFQMARDFYEEFVKQIPTIPACKPSKAAHITASRRSASTSVVWKRRRKPIWQR